MYSGLEIQETFFVDKTILAFFSGRLRKLFRFSTLRLRGTTGRMRVIFHEFPCSAEAFELISRYCYNRGNIKITLSNSLPLHLAAILLEINEDNISNGRLCLINQTRDMYLNLKGINLCPWSELVDCLKRFQEFLVLPLITKSPSIMFHEQQLLDCLVGRLSWGPYLSSHTPDSCSSSPIISTGRSSSYSSPSATNCWFKDFDFLNLDLFRKLVETMINAQKLDNFVISSFLFHYQEFKFRATPTPTTDEKCKIIETIIDLLHLLMNKSRSFIPLRLLFHILQRSLSLEVEKSHVERLEILIASFLDRATIDDLLFPSPRGKTYAYDVNLILRLQKKFLLQVGSNHFHLHRVKKVAALIDYYIAEVAPDPQLKPSKFVALVTGLPDFARDSHNMLYVAMDVYFKVHNNLCEEEKIELWSALNCDKLSAKSLIYLVHNSNFQACATATVGVSQYSNLGVLPRKGLSGHRAHENKGVGIEHQVNLDMNRLDFGSINDSSSRIRMLRSTEKASRKKQKKKVANILKLSSIC